MSFEEDDTEETVDEAYDRGVEDGKLEMQEEIQNNIIDSFCARCEHPFRTSPLLNIMYCSKDCENGNYKRPS